jgi:hypothetical protein
VIEFHAQAEAKVEYVFTQTKDDVEYHLIQTAHRAANAGNWVIGECASRWFHTYGKSKPDGWFANQIDVSEDKVWQCRRVWERFEKIHRSFKWISWSHFRAAVAWDDADECLEWAEDCKGSVREMEAYQRSKNGTLSTHVNQTVSFTGKEKPHEETPQRKVEPKATRAPVPESRNSAEGKTLRHTPATSGEAETVSKPGPVSSVPATVTETRTVQEAIRQIESLTQFVIDHGTEIEREALLARLKPVVSGLDPEKKSGRKTESVAASLAISNTVAKEWNMVDGITQCRSLTNKRRQAIAARWKEEFWRINWQKALEKIAKLPALHGKNDQNWVADIDWFLRPDTVARVIEGKYDNWKPTVTRSEHRAKSNRNAFSEVFGDDERATEADAVF